MPKCPRGCRLRVESWRSTDGNPEDTYNGVPRKRFRIIFLRGNIESTHKVKGFPGLCGSRHRSKACPAGARSDEVALLLIRNEPPRLNCIYESSGDSTSADVKWEYGRNNHSELRGAVCVAFCYSSSAQLGLYNRDRTPPETAIQ